MALNLVVSIVAIALGAFAAASPARAAEIWGSKRLEKLPPQQQVAFLRLYRVFGFLLCLAGLLVAIDNAVWRH